MDKLFQHSRRIKKPGVVRMVVGVKIWNMGIALTEPGASGR